MFERFNEDAREVIVQAQREAGRLRHDYIGTEHLLLGLLAVDEAVAAQVLASFDVELEQMRHQVERIVGAGDEPASGQIPFTPRAKRVIDMAWKEALLLGASEVCTEHILLGLLDEHEAVAARMLLDVDVDSERVRREVARALQRDELPAPPAVERYRPSRMEQLRHWRRYGPSYGHARAWAAMVVAGAAAAGVVLWQWASVDVNKAVPNACDPAFQVDPVGGWIVPAVLSLGPVAALLLLRKTAGTTSWIATVLAVLSALFFAFFWVQIIGLVECRIMPLHSLDVIS